MPLEQTTAGFGQATQSPPAPAVNVALRISLLAAHFTYMLIAAPAPAQVPSSVEDLAKLRANPLRGVRSVTLQDQVNFSFGSTGQSQNALSLQAVWPFPLGTNWTLVTQPIATAVAQPGSDPGQGRIYGLGDTVVTAAVTPNQTGTLIWGIGAVVEIPTATRHDLGTDSWAAGPAVAVFVEPDPWVLGVLLENAWSFAGASNDTVNAFEGEYFVTYNLPRGWFLESNATATADWEADPHDRWTLPLGGGGGKVFEIGKRSLSVSAQGFYNVVSPSSGTEWSLSLALQILFPG